MANISLGHPNRRGRNQKIDERLRRACEGELMTSEIVCPNCDTITVAIDTPERSPAIVSCSYCGYSEIENTRPLNADTSEASQRKEIYTDAPTITQVSS